ncbi:hypothetical protein FRC11_008171 [Ceratobasidium sp. 423]|nr:hypothetical protein FRC11_008171 [Ceratobasidium sp. 423]
MSNSKRRFGFLGIPNSCDSSSKLTVSPAIQATTKNASTSNPSTQPAPVSQLGSGPDHKTKEMAKAVLSKLKKSLTALQQSCGIFAPLVTAVGTLQVALEQIERTYWGADDIQDSGSHLAQWAILLAGFLEENQPIRMSKQMENLTDVLRHEAEYLRKQSLRKQSEGGPIRPDAWEQNMQELKSFHSQIEEVLRQLLESLLNGMLPTHDALYDSRYADKIERGPCLENTRVTVLDGIRSWMYNLSETKVYWINGMAGTGKTTIAYSVCEELARNKRLGASFFVSRASSQCRDVSRILPTIAYQLGRVSYLYRCALCRMLNGEPNVAQRKLSVQFEYLIRSPLLEVADKIPRGLVVVIDALDECSDPRTTELIVNMLLRHAPELPVRFFLTSRPEPSIIDTILSNDGESRSVLHLHNVEEQLVKADIKTYLNMSLARLKPTGDQIEWLAEQAGVLFIYAATLVRYVLATGFGRNSRSRLEAILAPNTERASRKDRAIDRLYRVILEGALEGEEREEHEQEVLKQVLWTVVCVREPVTKQTLAMLLQVDSDQVAEALYLVQSVIHVSEATGIVSTLHASFPEFMLHSSRSGPLGCNKEGYNQYLATRCFSIMEEQLRFNICRLKSSYDYDKDIPGIDAQVDATILPELFYACRFWAEHLARATFCNELIKKLDLFLDAQLLFWMEVLNLKGWVKNGQNVLMEAKNWLMTNQRNSNFLDDAIEFVISFGENPVSSSTPHIYVSHLPLGPKQNRGLVRVEGTAAETSKTGPLSLTAPTANSAVVSHSKRISSIAFSPDGTRIATGSDGGTIHIWNSNTGNITGDPIKLHIGSVRAMVFSSDGLSLAFAFANGGNRLIQIWGTHDGTSCLRPTLFSTEALTPSICFSPDGARIAFSSIGNFLNQNKSRHFPTLTVFDVGTGNTLLELSLPTGAAYVTFSSDGNAILSLLFNRTIHMWNSYTGTPYNIDVAGPLSSDISRLLSAPTQGSQDEYRLASKSNAYFVTQYGGRTADRNGFDYYSYVSTPNHAAAVMSSSSPKKHFTFGYNWVLEEEAYIPRYTIDCRDPRTDCLSAGPFGRKGETITAFAFSPDGTRIFSGSELSATYYAVRAWDIWEGPSSSQYAESWEISADGWIRDQDSRPVIWVPREWQALVPLPPNCLAIGPEGSLRIFATNLLLGESWSGCYNPLAPDLSLQMEP